MPEERRMTITSSPHLAPDDVARHTFASVRRGFDPNEVRDYLESIAHGLKGIAEREHQLLAELADAEDRAAHPVLDEPTLTAALGQETARVLHSAHEVAAEMVAKAEAEANRLVTEATEEVDQSRAQTDALIAEQAAASETAVSELRERTNQQAAAALESARREADEVRAKAKEDGRTMVEEAQQLRARVLADLSRRRKVMHAQIEQLRAGRERLTETINEVRRSIDVIADDLFGAEDDARLAAEEAGREAVGRADENTPEEMAARLLAEEAAASSESEEAHDERADTGGGGPDVPPDAAPETGSEEEEEVSGEGGGASPSDEPPAEKVDALFAKIRAARETTGADVHSADDADSAVPPAGAVPAGKKGATKGRDAVASTEPGAEEEPDEADGVPPDGRNPLAIRRDDLITPIVTTLARRLKRTLQDNQNDLLDILRSNGSQWSTGLLPEEKEQVDAYATAALAVLEEAAEAGATFAGTGSSKIPSADVLLGIAHDLAVSIVGPLRRRLSADDGLTNAEESVVAEHVGSAFREWKGERIERLAGDHVVAAFSEGSISAIASDPNAQLEWVAVSATVDAAPCPDCDDNGLNGSQPPGEEFPTGHRYPPAHPGCRCLLAPSAT
jgi:DivIVA domain-containing protein